MVEKAELMKRVWPGCVVEETGLSRNISILRRAIDDERFAFIETVPRRGYRFVRAPAPDGAGTDSADGAARTRHAEPAESAPLPEPPPIVTASVVPAARKRRWLAALAVPLLAGFLYWQFYRPSPYLPESGRAAVLAVIPVECLTPGLARDAYVTGLGSALAAELTRFPHIQLISPGTVARYHRIGGPVPLMTRLLGVHVVVEGTAQLSGSLICVSLRLSDVRSGKLIWAREFDEPASDPLASQTRIAGAAAAGIAAALRATR